MGKIYSTLTRPIRTFNVANRAEKVISTAKPISAPQYASTEKQRKLVDQVNPTFLEDHYQKNERLDQRLKSVFVTSTDSPEAAPVNKSKSLPRNRHSPDEIIFGFYEPTVIPEGKCSLKQAFTFILEHKYNPTIYSSENIAIKYKLDTKVVDDILKHFKFYVSVTPDNPDQPVEVDPFQDILDVGYKNYHENKKLQEKKKE